MAILFILISKKAYAYITCLPNALAIAIFSKTAIKGSMIMAAPRLDNISPKCSVTCPVVSFLTENGGTWKIPSSPPFKFPVKIKVVFLIDPSSSGSSGSQPYAIKAVRITTIAFLPTDVSQMVLARIVRTVGERPPHHIWHFVFGLFSLSSNQVIFLSS